MKKPKFTQYTQIFFFPVFGLMIEDRSDGLQSPLFGDSTVLSKEALLRFTKSPPHYIESTSADSYLAVRREWKFHCEEDANGYTREYERLDQAVSKRAYEVAAMIGLGFASQNQNFFHFPEHFVEAGKDYIHWKGGEKSVSYHSTAKGFSISARPQKGISRSMTRRKLLWTLRQEPQRSLTQILQTPQPKLPPTILRPIRQCAVLLSRGMHTQDLSTQILNALTGLETLLTEETNRQNVLERRIEALVGHQLANKYGVNSIFKARNAIVHEGISVPFDNTGLAWNALLLGLICLIHYASLASKFARKNELISYLDFLTAGERLLPIWSEKEQRSYSRLLRHERRDMGIICLRYAPLSRDPLVPEC